MAIQQLTRTNNNLPDAFPKQARIINLEDGLFDDISVYPADTVRNILTQLGRDNGFYLSRGKGEGPLDPKEELYHQINDHVVLYSCRQVDVGGDHDAP